MPRVVHFEIPTDDPDRAAKFYQDVFGWNIQKWEGDQEYWLATTGESNQPGINGGLMKRADFPNFTQVINTIDVPDVDEFTAAIAAHGGQMVMPKFVVPGIGFLAYCQDTEGNTFGVMQGDPTAR